MQVALCTGDWKQATSLMSSRPLTRSCLLQAIIAGAIFLFTDRPCVGSIVVPDALGLIANYFECLSVNKAISSSAPENSKDPEPENDLQKSDPWDFLKALGSGGSSTSSSSTSSTGGASGVSCVLCVGDTKICGDDSDCGRLAEDRSLFLPDPPGTELFHPPRNCS